MYGGGATTNTERSAVFGYPPTSSASASASDAEDELVLAGADEIVVGTSTHSSGGGGFSIDGFESFAYLGDDVNIDHDGFEEGSEGEMQL